MSPRFKKASISTLLTAAVAAIEDREHVLSIIFNDLKKSLYSVIMHVVGFDHFYYCTVFKQKFKYDKGTLYFPPEL